MSSPHAHAPIETAGPSVRAEQPQEGGHEGEQAEGQGHAPTRTERNRAKKDKRRQLRRQYDIAPMVQTEARVMSTQDMVNCMRMYLPDGHFLEDASTDLNGLEILGDPELIAPNPAVLSADGHLMLGGVRMAWDIPPLDGQGRWFSLDVISQCFAAHVQSFRHHLEQVVNDPRAERCWAHEPSDKKPWEDRLPFERLWCIETGRPYFSRLGRDSAMTSTRNVSHLAPFVSRTRPG